MDANWNQRLLALGVQVKPPLFGDAIPPSDETAIAALLKEFAPLKCPEDYLSFCRQIGGGTLGRVKVFFPSNDLWFHDLRFHTLRLLELFSRGYEKVHSFPLTELVFFARDVEEDLWFAWRRDHSSSGDHSIYCLDEQPRSPPPKKVISSFAEFVEEVCLGTKLPEMKLRKFTEDPRKDTGDDDEEWSDEDSDAPQASDKYEAPAKILRKFAQRG